MHQSGTETVRPATDSIWPQHSTDFADVNLDPAERRFSVGAGGLLVFAGLRRHSLSMILSGGAFLYRGITGYCPVYRALENSIGTPLSEGLQFEDSIAVNKPVEEIYALWRHIENLPRFMLHLESVTPIDANRSHWIARMPAPLRLEWDAAITDDQPNKKISWCSLPSSRVHHAGSVFFHPLTGRGGVEIKIIFNYKPPAGSAGTAAAKLVNMLTRRQIRADLRAFKAVAETGEKPTTLGQPSGRSPRWNGIAAEMP